LFSKVKEKMSMAFYKEMKLRWKEAYVNCCYRSKGTGTAWWRIGIWKMRGIRKGLKTGRCPLLPTGR
jgi:hypothetical protein